MKHFSGLRSVPSSNASRPGRSETILRDRSVPVSTARQIQAHTVSSAGVSDHIDAINPLNSRVARAVAPEQLAVPR